MKATSTATPLSASMRIVPPQPNVSSSGWGAKTRTDRWESSKGRLLLAHWPAAGLTKAIGNARDGATQVMRCRKAEEKVVDPKPTQLQPIDRTNSHRHKNHRQIAPA